MAAQVYPRVIFQRASAHYFWQDYASGINLWQTYPPTLSAPPLLFPLDQGLGRQTYASRPGKLMG